jgi:hypothetical protein
MGRSKLNRVAFEPTVHIRVAEWPPRKFAGMPGIRLRDYGTTITSPIRRKKFPGLAFPFKMSS